MKLRHVVPFVLVLWTGTAFAQEQQAPQGGGGGQTPAQPQPGGGNTPDRQPRQPNVSPFPEPTPQQNQILNLRGRIITGNRNVDLNSTQVRFETEGGQPVGYAYADSGGEFYFQNHSGFSFDQNVYVVVNVEGFKPFRDRISGGFGITMMSGFITIFLETENEPKGSAKGGPAIVDLKQLRAKVPGKAVDEYERAMKESSKGNREKAVEGLQRAIKLAPDFYEAQHTLGLQYLALQKFDDAESALTRARDLSPKAAEPLINLGSVYYQRAEAHADAGRAEEAAATYHKAVDVLDESIRRNALSPSAHAYLGAALYKLGTYERAETVLNRAIELDDNQQNARLMLVNVYVKSARYKDALEQINTFITKNPKSPQRQPLEKIKEQIERALTK